MKKVPCKFGPNCYRKAADHLAQFSHEEVELPQDTTTDVEQVSKKPMCTYGPSCYRKNQEHLNDFSHDFNNADISTEQGGSQLLDDQGDVKCQTTRKGEGRQTSITNFFGSNTDGRKGSVKREAEISNDAKSSEPPAKKSTASQVPTETTPEARKKEIEEKFLVKMPSDFYACWEFIVAEGAASELKDMGVKLVGPFELLAGDFDAKTTSLLADDYLIHWRFRCDPPEFQTLIVFEDRHYGYYRDIPTEESSLVCSMPNDTANFPTFQMIGDNLFAALYEILNVNKSTCKKHTSLLEKLEERCDTEYVIGKPKEAKKQRYKKLSGGLPSTLHGAGIYVELKDDVGYRHLAERDPDLRKILTAIGESKDPLVVQRNEDKLQEVITYVQFANDEADFGTGLELGHDLLISGYEKFNPQINQLLGVAYMLLKRPQFSKISDAHLKCRNRNNDKLSVL